MKKFVISLSTAQERRKHIVAEFTKQEVDFEFFDAITPVNINLMASQLGLVEFTTDLHENEVGCLLSHMILWKKAIDEQLDYIAIFEDDIYLGENAKDFLLDTTWIPKECSVIKLEVFYKKIGVALKQQHLYVPHDRELLLLREAHMGCGGYILSQEVAQKLLNYIVKSKVLIPVDHFLFRECPKLDIYQLSPALCIQDVILKNGQTEFPSALEEVRNIRKGKYLQKEKLKYNIKLKKEILRIFKQIQKLILNMTKFRRGIKTVKIKFR
ncbi:MULTISPECIES: glycosyltransferase family 25 protein [unclassified Acinetobacter]|uniref:glycosyltransferase family 25 protein n=1 Tax=unclassified Acinetobacter TaxID=196816 RepID=UPI0018AAE92B|nr:MULTISPECIES: glycosyltransferase family 25 protein [unclassified Acinetobacter]MBJ9952873.1 glycosyltransferase family 25 protein [Acinetobacter baumannii]